jgi:hypothetical protein
MKVPIMAVGAVVVCLSLFATGLSSAISAADQLSQSEPIAFTLNVGQWDSTVLARGSLSGMTIWVTREGVYYQFTRFVPSVENLIEAVFGGKATVISEAEIGEGLGDLESVFIRVGFRDCNSDFEVDGDGLLSCRSNYFLGNDPSRWRTDVPAFSALTLVNIYDGIDIRYYCRDGKFEYDLLVSPGADLAQVRICYEGVEACGLDQDGNLVLSCPWNTVIETIPSVFQPGAAESKLLSARFVLVSNNIVGFAVEGDYEEELALIVDPQIGYSSYLGGSAMDEGRAVCVSYEMEVEENRAVYAGYTSSADFPTVSPLDGTLNSEDAFISKVTGDGSTLVFSTYFGGTSQERCWDAEMAANGDIVLVGHTGSLDFPTVNAYDDTYNGPSGDPFHAIGDVFVTRINSEGNALVYSTYLGGSLFDRAWGLGLAPGGAAVLTGETRSPDFPTQNPYQANLAGDTVDAFLSVLSAAGDQLLYSTYLGGGEVDRGKDAGSHADGQAYATGETNSSDFPVLNAYQATIGGNSDIFVAHADYNTGTFQFATFVGGGGHERGDGIDLSASGDIYVAGYTSSFNFPTMNAYDDSRGGWSDAFVIKLSPDGQNLLYGTFIGGSDSEYGYGGVELDLQGDMHLCGSTYSIDFPLAFPFDSTLDGNADGWYAELSADGSQLLQSTYLGGSNFDLAGALAVDQDGAAYLTGETNSTDFPTVNAFSTSFGGPLYDAFAMKIEPRFWICGDADANSVINVSDIVWMINFVFGSGQPPDPMQAGDVDCNGSVNVSDVVYLINFVFGTGNEPCDTDGDGNANC